MVPLIMLFLVSSPASAFTWGVCGHQIWGNQLWQDPETQFATMERYGLTTYRFDVPLADNHPEAAEKLQKLIVFAAKHHITLHPILYVPFTWGDNATDSGKYPATEAGLESQGYNRVYPFVLQFSSQIRDWELENELSLKKGVKTGIGNSVADYETEKAHQWAAVLRGMSRAIHDVQAKTGKPLRVAIDFMGVDYGLIDFLQQHGVMIDKLAYHYYYELKTNPYDLRFKNGPTDIFAQFRRLDKPVIINEFNAAEIYEPKKHIPYDDAKALASLKEHIEYISNQKKTNIEGVEYYELYNESEKDVAESNFGLMSDPDHPRTQMLLAATYACGKLSLTERKALVANALFSEGELEKRLSSCGKW